MRYLLAMCCHCVEMLLHTSTYTGTLHGQIVAHLLGMAGRSFGMVHFMSTRRRASRKSAGKGAFICKDSPVLGCVTFILTACRSCLAAHENCNQQSG